MSSADCYWYCRRKQEKKWRRSLAPRRPKRKPSARPGRRERGRKEKNNVDNAPRMQGRIKAFTLSCPNCWMLTVLHWSMGITCTTSKTLRHCHNQRRVTRRSEFHNMHMSLIQLVCRSSCGVSAMKMPTKSASTSENISTGWSWRISSCRL